MWGLRRELMALRQEIYPIIGRWAIRELANQRISWTPPRRKEKLNNGQGIKLQLPGFGSNALLPSASRRMHIDEDGSVALVHQPERVTTKWPKTQSAMGINPDPMTLEHLGMTLEEFQESEAKIEQQKFEEENAAILAARTLRQNVEAEEMEQAEVYRPQRFSVLGETVLSVEPPLARLDSEALARLDNVSTRALPQRAPRQDKNESAPWDEFAMEKAKRGGDRKAAIEHRVGRPDLPPAAERKEGVVYPESFNRQALKRRGLKLSPESLERIDEAAARARKGSMKSPEDDKHHNWIAAEEQFWGSIDRRLNINALTMDAEDDLTPEEED